MRRVLALVVVGTLIVVAAACSDDAKSTSGTTPPPTAPPPPASNTTPTPVPPPLPVDAGDGGSCTPPDKAPTVIFLNRGGGTYTVGAQDAKANTTSLDTETNVIPAWAVGDEDLNGDNQKEWDKRWKGLNDCVANKFAKLNVTVTDVDPGQADHIEIVFVPASAHVVSSPAVVSYCAQANCGTNPNAIGFISRATATFTVDLERGCAAAGLIAGFALGLESVFIAGSPDAGVQCDAMSGDLAKCPREPFDDAAVTCGATSAETCECTGGGTTQNSFQVLKEAIGPKCTNL